MAVNPAELVRGLRRPGVLVAAGLFVWARWIPTGAPTWTWLIDLVICVGAAVSLWRLMLGTSIVAIGLALWWLPGAGLASASPLAVFIPVYVAVRQDWRTGLSMTLLALGLSVPLAIQDLDGPDQITTVLFLLAVVALVWLIAILESRANLRLVVAEQDRLDALQQQRHALARELHDTVAQTSTLIVLQAEIAKGVPGLPPAAVGHLDQIEALGRESVKDLRGLLKALRRLEDDPVGDLALHRGTTVADAVTTQRTRLEQAGFAMEAEVEVPEGLAPSLQRTVAALLQESVSNVIKYADPAEPCQIRILTIRGQLDLSVTNRVGQRPAKAVARRGAGTGLGLIGTRERVEALDGTFSASVHDGRWTSSASLPLH